MQQDARDFQAAAARDREADRQEILRRTATPQPTPGPSCQESSQPRLPYPPADFGIPARQPPPYPTQGYSASSAPQAICTQGLPVPPPVQPTRPPGTDLLPDGDETFTDFCPPQFAVPTHSIGEEWLRRAGLDPQLLQQVADPASALRADAQSSKQANLILRGVGLADPSTTGALNQKASDNPPLTAQWPHKKVWLAKTGHWVEYDDSGTVRPGLLRDHASHHPSRTIHQGCQRPHWLLADHDTRHLLLPLASSQIYKRTDSAYGGT